MIDLLIALVSLGLLALVFSRRWYLMDKASQFGKMVLRKDMQYPDRITKDDHEVTAKELIPEPETVDPKLRVKGENYYKKALQEMKNGALDEAERMLIKALAMDPSHMEAYSKLGVIYLNQEQFGKAELIYRKLVLTTLDDAALFSNLGLSLFHQEKYQEAKEFYEKAIEIDDSRPGRFYSLARTNQALDDYEDAFKNIETALAMDPDNIDYGLTLASWQIDKDMHKDAKDIVENVLKMDPENEVAKDMLKQFSQEAKTDEVVKEEK